LAKQGVFTQDKIERLLGEMGDKSLGTASIDDELELNLRPSVNCQQPVMTTLFSVSTYLFGTSEMGTVRDFDAWDFQHQHSDGALPPSALTDAEVRAHLLSKDCTRSSSSHPLPSGMQDQQTRTSLKGGRLSPRLSPRLGKSLWGKSPEPRGKHKHAALTDEVDPPPRAATISTLPKGFAGEGDGGTLPMLVARTATSISVLTVDPPKEEMRAATWDLETNVPLPSMPLVSQQKDLDCYVNIAGALENGPCLLPVQASSTQPPGESRVHLSPPTSPTLPSVIEVRETVSKETPDVPAIVVVREAESLPQSSTTMSSKGSHGQSSLLRRRGAKEPPRLQVQKPDGPEHTPLR